jgi:hypothetical protein
MEAPQYIIDAAKRGLELLREGKGGDGLTEGTKDAARKMADGEVSEEKVVKASAWHARHKVDLDSPNNSNPQDKDYPAAGAVAHLLWGINPLDPQPARDWFDRQSEKIQNEKSFAMGTSKKHYFTALETEQIDLENGIIRSVSLMEMGDAKGHFDKKGRQVIIDTVTLQQVFNACNKLGSIKVKADHGSGVFEIVGWADNFSLKADKVCADVHIYESEPNRKRLFEIAEKNPTHMGVSMEFTGEDKPSGTTSMSRCDAVYAAALVDDPAANSSLFSVPATKAEQYLEEQTNTNNKMEPENDDKKDPAIADLMAKHEELMKRISALEMPMDKMKSDMEEDDKKPDSEMKENEEKMKLEEDEQDKKAKLGEDEQDKKIEMAAKRGAEAAIKLFAAKLGMTNLGKAGPLNSNAKEKHFEEHVADLAVKEFSGDQGKARTAILTNTGKYTEAWNAYKATRLVKTA